MRSVPLPSLADEMDLAEPRTLIRRDGKAESYEAANRRGAAMRANLAKARAAALARKRAS